MSSVTDCPVCSEVLPPGRNLYCCDRCRERAKKQRQRTRAAGGDVAVPVARRRRAVADELADRLLSQRVEHDAAQRDELTAAQRETARLAAELAVQRRAARDAERNLGRERDARRRIEREARFVSMAFARTTAAHSIADQIPAAIRERVSAWLPETENPWH